MVLDILILLLVISALIRGREIGFVQQLFSTVGFFVGLFIGTQIEPITVGMVHTQLSRALVTLATTIGSAFILLSVGEYIGAGLKHRVAVWKLNKFDDLLGAVISVASVLVGVWLGAAILRTLPYVSFQQDINSSKIISFLDRHLPPAPNVIADLGHLVDPNGFPRVFNGNEPSPPGSVALPSYASIATAVQTDKPSVVKVVGTGCGGLVEGSGFVVAPGLVATNAHVVAGITHPDVLDNNGTHPATAIYFNPNLDFALLRVNDLAGRPLHVTDQIAKPGTPGAVLGYPGGGNFTADPGVIIDEFNAYGSNIYAQGTTQRDVYEIEANVIPGNSGGPLVNTDGTVVGVVFAASTEYNKVGYALVTKPIVSIINQNSADTRPVGTGSCTD